MTIYDYVVAGARPLRLSNRFIELIWCYATHLNVFATVRQHYGTENEGF